MKVTIKEIAEMAGVHRATVDKVLHHRVGVSDEVRQRVQQIIDQVEYKPNPAGRALQKQGTTYRLAAVLVEVDALPYLQQGVEQGVRARAEFDIAVEFHTTKFQDAAAQAAILDRLVGERVDGIILSPINSALVRGAIDRAAQAGIPVITTNSDIADSRRLCYVGMDGERASRVAGRLMGQFIGGSGQIAIISSAISSENNNYYVAIRERGFTEFIKANYPAAEIVACVESLEDAAITYQKTVELLRQYPALSGLYITCGGAPEVGRALRESGREQSVRVVAFEDYPEILALLRDGVIDCTLASDLRQQGAAPVRLLMDHLVYGKKPQNDQVFGEIKILVRECLY